MRGEKMTRKTFELFASGSSPHAWGKDPPLQQCYQIIRIIPTCVGKRKAVYLDRRHVTDHPHMRGEKGADSEQDAKDRGSSPHAWGKA